MEKFMKSLIRGNYITSAILIVLGLLLTIRSDDTIVAISYLIGGSIIIIGVLALIKFVKNLGKSFDNSFEIIYGIITIVFGILILSNPKMVATIIPFVIGGWIVIKSSFKIAYAIELKNRGSLYWKSALITSIINALVGILIVFNPFKTSVIVFKIIGIAILVYAVLDIVSTIQIKRDFPKTNDKEEDTNIEKITTNEVIVDADIEEIKEADIEEEVNEEIKEENEETVTDKTEEEPTEEKETKPKKKKRKTKKNTNKKKDSE